MSKNRSDIGHHFVVGLHGTSLLEEEKKLLEEIRPAGIILFKRNFDYSPGVQWQETLENLLQEVKRYIGRENYIVSVDHEGGRVHRFPEPVTRFPAQKYVKDKAYEVAAAMAEELGALGVNVSYSPVLDIHSEEKNPVIGERAFGKTPEEVIARGKEFIRGLEEHGILACGKHFPGHGATLQDSHLSLPVLEVEEEKLRARELRPFKELANTLRLIMTAHVLYPKLDAQYPATLSSRIITTILRGECHYQGVVISDDLSMKALQHFTKQEQAKRCLEAGVDLLLCGFIDEEIPLRIAATMAEAMTPKVIDEEILARSAKRITILFNEICRLRSKQSLNRELVGCEEHQVLAGTIVVK